MGGIPWEFDWLQHLERLYLAQNHFFSADSTPIFGALSNFTSLQKLSLRNNALKSDLPGSVGQLSQTLFYLSLTENHCTGSIPQEMSNPTGLITLYIGRNFLSGSLPSALGGIYSLQLLQLSENKLEALLLDTASEVLPLVVPVVGRVGSKTPINFQNSSLKCVILEEMAEQHFLKHNDVGWIPNSALMLPIIKEIP
jgi:Leucine-rich repeat (LRR) protein